MNKIIRITFLGSALVVSSPAYGEKFYSGFQGGVNILASDYLEKNHCKFDVGYEVGLVSGFEWCNGFRLEGEIAYRNNDYRLRGVSVVSVPTTFHGHIDTWSFMVNGYYELSPLFCQMITPYAGVGIGCDHVHQSIKIEGENFTGSNVGFAWQLMGGARAYLGENFFASMEYKYPMPS